MSRNLLTLLSSILMVVFILVACSRGDKDKASGDQYTCPMHPTVISPSQSTCPVCGMDLVKKARAGEELKITEDLARLLQSPDERVVANMPTVQGTFKSMPISFEAQGIVTYDSRYMQAISARVAGRLEQVHLHYSFQPVRKGQIMAEIYSPEMLAAQRELLFLIKNDPGNETLIRSAREKVMLLGATPSQVDEWVRKGEPDPLFTIYSPYSGYIVVGQAPTSTPISVKPAATPMDGKDMTTAPTTSAENTSVATGITHEGGYVSRGQTLFRVVSREAMRIELSVPSSRARQIKVGGNLKMDIGLGQSVSARVDFVQPFYSEGEAFVKVRAYVRNDELRIGQLVRAVFTTSSAETLWLPKEAVYDLGTRQIVFVKERGLFKPVDVITGVQADGWIEIRSGLASADEVAAQSAYLVDSESFIKTGTK